VQIQAYLCAIVQNLKRLLFPLYCWLLAHCRSHSTSTTPALPATYSRPSIDCQTKKAIRTFSTGPTDFDRLHAAGHQLIRLTALPGAPETHLCVQSDTRRSFPRKKRIVKSTFSKTHSLQCRRNGRTTRAVEPCKQYAMAALSAA
jgi:hypothetical protein